MTLVTRLDFHVDGDVVEALADFAARADDVFSRHGFEVEARGRDWAHWVRDPQAPVRAYAFTDGEHQGISLTGPMSAALAAELLSLLKPVA